MGLIKKFLLYIQRAISDNTLKWNVCLTLNVIFIVSKILLCYIIFIENYFVKKWQYFL